MPLISKACVQEGHSFSKAAPEGRLLPTPRWHSGMMPQRPPGDLAIDLGTANTVVFARGRGIVMLEPSVIAIDEGSGKVLAVGAEAKRMIGRTPGRIRALRPLRHGVLTDFDVTEQMLAHFMRRAIDRRFTRPQVMLCVPSGLTALERDAVEEAARAAGARAVYLIEEPLAAAIGADLPIAEPVASMVLDIGGGTTEIAVISLGSMVVWRSVRIGGYEMDDALISHMKREHGLEIGEGRAEQLKIVIGSAAKVANEEAEVNGRDLRSGGLRTATVNAREVHEALTQTVGQIIDAVRDTLEETPPELSADISEHGIVLAGVASSCATFHRGFGLRRGYRSNSSPSRLRASRLVRAAAWTSSVRSPGRRSPRSAADTPDPAGSGLRGAVEPSLHALHGNSGPTQQPSDLEATDRNLAHGLG